MRIGTASVRRKAQLLALEPSLSIEPLRGNIDTRLRKRGERGLDAIVLAACGLDRLGLGAEIGHRFEPETMLPEAGQGALALQVRAGDVHLVAAADDPETRERVEAERAVVAAVGGGCLAPVAAHHDGSTLTGARRGGGRIVDRAAHGRRSRGARGGAGGCEYSSRVEELVARVEALGHDAVLCELIRVEPLGDEPVDARAYDWLVVTSRNGAHELARRGVTANRIAAIGPRRPTRCARTGCDVDLVAATHTQEGLRDELPAGDAPARRRRGRAAGRPRRRLPAALPDDRAAARRAGRRCRAAHVRLRRPGARRDRRAHPCRRHRPPDRGRGPGSRARRRRPSRRLTTSTGSSRHYVPARGRSPS